MTNAKCISQVEPFWNVLPPNQSLCIKSQNYTTLNRDLEEIRHQNKSHFIMLQNSTNKIISSSNNISWHWCQNTYYSTNPNKQPKKNFAEEKYHWFVVTMERRRVDKKVLEMSTCQDKVVHVMGMWPGTKTKFFFLGNQRENNCVSWQMGYEIEIEEWKILSDW